MGLVIALFAGAQQKPLTRDQVQGLVRDGLGDESGAKLIEQRGIDFALVEDFLESLKAAGASEAFLKALRAAKQPEPASAKKRMKVPASFLTPIEAKQPEPASAKKPLNQVKVIALLGGQVASHRVAMLVKERGLDFEPEEDYLADVRVAGGDDELINALKSAEVTKPVTVDPTAQARQAEVRQHVAHGAEFYRKRQYAEAEREYRTTLLLDSQNADVYMSLASVLMRQERWDDAASAAREAVRLNPNNDMAHTDLGLALYHKSDTDGATAEFAEALRLNPDNDWAHLGLGGVLYDKGDLDGATAEFREGLRLNPKNDAAYASLGAALGAKGDQNGAIAQARQALRLNPNNDGEHYLLGLLLEEKGDRRGALEEYRAAYTLDPKNATFKQNYERLLQQVTK